MAPEREADKPLENTKAAYARSSADRGRTIEALDGVQAALAHAAAGDGWLEDVVSSLGVLDHALEEEGRTWTRPDALIILVATENSRRYRSRVRRLEEEFNDIQRQVTSLRRQLSAATDPAGAEANGTMDPTDIRHRVEWVTRAIRHYQARQTDLIYEALELNLGENPAS